MYIRSHSLRQSVPSLKLSHPHKRKLPNTRKITMSLLQLPLAGKTALVTGGIRGIGRGISLELARRGANVAMVYANPSRAETAKEAVKEVASLNSGAKAVSIQADLKISSNYQKIIDEALQELGVQNIDIVVHNAAYAAPISTETTTEAIYDDTMATNVRAPFFLTQKLLPYIPRGGRIILISSIAARRFSFGMNQTAYAISKAAVEALARNWAVEFGQSCGITVNALSVGFVETELVQSLSPEALEAYRKENARVTAAAPRSGTPDDIAQIVAFIADEGSRWVTGSTISANGGKWPI
ncbi:Versicolorin reductase [Trichoderma lentiforme]|uniref:Versicolorin reductase n=1 Tax=Trichoderma lentiforme TaxID=1567552 RepID=A0A9P4XH31_9HYPO|nr:Versicolorin reductase [Trichoderma lentiforme]